MRCSFRTHLFSRTGFPGRCPGLVCIAPFRANCGSQSDALSWYALPRWANGTMAFRSRVHAPTGIASRRVGAAPLEPIPQPRSRSHAPTGHRIPAQGANPGNPPGKETRVLKERRIAAGLGTTFWHGTGCEEAVSYSPTRTSALPGQVWKPGPPYPATAAALPPAPWVRIRIFCSRGLLTPVAAPNASPNICLAWGRMRITGFVLADEDVSAPGPNVETGAGVPGYSGGLAASP